MLVRTQPPLFDSRLKAQLGREEVEMLLDEERQRREFLGSRVMELEQDAGAKTRHIQAAEGKAREAIERSREQVHTLLNILYLVLTVITGPTDRCAGKVTR